MSIPNRKKGDFLLYIQGIVPWLCLLMSLLLIAIVFSIPHHRRRRFFTGESFWGYDDKIPQYMGQSTMNVYLKRIRFKSRIPYAEWEKIKPDLEMFYRKKIYKMKQSKGDIRIMDIYLIQEDLPSFIKWEDAFMEPEDKFAIGECYTGKVIWDALAFPHGLCAGASSAGKTNLLRCIIHQAIFKKWNVQVLDFKGGGDYAGVERAARKYYDLEKGYGPFITSDPEEARQLLFALTIEAKSRLADFKKSGVSNITEYNASGRGYFVPWLLVIDEAAELLDVKPKDKVEKEMYAEIDHYLRTLARISRAAGVHILMGFIRPDSTVLDSQVKNNLLWRACGYFADPAASRIVLDNDKATELPPEIKGRFIVGDKEVQAYYMPISEASPEEVGPGGEAEREPPACPPLAEDYSTK